MHVLLVEDDPLNRLYYEISLQAHGVEYTSCGDGETALTAYRRTFYPLVVQDLDLPDMDGIELCRRLRSLPNGDQSIIIVISGRDSLRDQQASLAAGANEFLSKPVTSDMFIERICWRI